MMASDRIPGLRKRGEVWHLEKCVYGLKVFKSLKTTDIEEAKKRADSIVNTMLNAAVLSSELMTPEDWRVEVEKAMTHCSSWARKIIKSARDRGLPKGPEYYSMTLDDWKDAFLACGGRCSVSGLAFDMRKRGTIKGVIQPRRPWFPSADRIDSSVGYIPGNVRIVCVAANLAMSTWGDEVLHKLALAVVSNRQKLDRCKDIRIEIFA